MSIWATSEKIGILQIELQVLDTTFSPADAGRGELCLLCKQFNALGRGGFAKIAVSGRDGQ